jgi:hypothetical protein
MSPGADDHSIHRPVVPGSELGYSSSHDNMASVTRPTRTMTSFWNTSSIRYQSACRSRHLDPETLTWQTIQKHTMKYTQKNTINSTSGSGICQTRPELHTVIPGIYITTKTVGYHIRGTFTITKRNIELLNSESPTHELCAFWSCFSEERKWIMVGI